MKLDLLVRHTDAMRATHCWKRETDPDQENEVLMRYSASHSCVRESQTQDGMRNPWRPDEPDTGIVRADDFHELDGFAHARLAAGSLVAVGLLALAALAVFGTWISLGVLLIGTALAVLVEPTVWLPGC